jgi:hypothetical protein
VFYYSFFPFCNRSFCRSYAAVPKDRLRLDKTTRAYVTNARVQERVRTLFTFPCPETGCVALETTYQGITRHLTRDHQCVRAFMYVTAALITARTNQETLLRPLHRPSEALSL